MDKTYSFVADTADTRLDRFVGDNCAELSRTHAQKLITDGYITVNGHVARASLKLNTGDTVEVIILLIR